MFNGVDFDGCAAQFAGKNNYHQDAVWATKTGVIRGHFTHEANDEDL